MVFLPSGRIPHGSIGAIVRAHIDKDTDPSDTNTTSNAPPMVVPPKFGQAPPPPPPAVNEVAGLPHRKAPKAMKQRTVAESHGAEDPEASRCGVRSKRSDVRESENTEAEDKHGDRSGRSNAHKDDRTTLTAKQEGRRLLRFLEGPLWPGRSDSP